MSDVCSREPLESILDTSENISENAREIEKLLWWIISSSRLFQMQTTHAIQRFIIAWRLTRFNLESSSHFWLKDKSREFL